MACPSLWLFASQLLPFDTMDTRIDSQNIVTQERNSRFVPKAAVLHMSLLASVASWTTCCNATVIKIVDPPGYSVSKQCIHSLKKYFLETC